MYFTVVYYNNNNKSTTDSIGSYLNLLRVKRRSKTVFPRFTHHFFVLSVSFSPTFRIGCWRQCVTQQEQSLLFKASAGGVAYGGLNQFSAGEDRKQINCQCLNKSHKILDLLAHLFHEL